jgi:hypothetical protein
VFDAHWVLSNRNTADRGTQHQHRLLTLRVAVGGGRVADVFDDEPHFWSTRRDGTFVVAAAA